MPVDPHYVEEAMRSGMIFVCATCDRYWEGQSRGLETCTGRCCGSPLKGMAFPEYTGILTEERFSQWCFICSRQSTHGVLLAGHTRMCGVCDKHLAALHPKNLSVDAAIKTGGHLFTLARFFGPVRRTIGEEIYEVEKYFADKEGRPLVPDQADIEGGEDATPDLGVAEARQSSL